MILTIEEIKAHLPLNSITDVSKYEAFEIRAFYKYLPKYLGDALVEVIYNFGTPQTDSSGSELDPDAPDIENLIKYVKPVLANLTILESIPKFNLIATGNGFGIVSNPNQAPASMERVRELKDACLVSANDGLDRLLLFLETNASKFGSWNKSCINTGSLIPSASVFDQFIEVNCSRRRFVDLKRHINFEESTTFVNTFSSEFLAVLRSGSDTQVKPLVQLALALLGEIHYQRSLNPEAEIAQLHNKYIMALSNALSFLRQHLTDYPDYANHAYEAPYNNATDGQESGFFIGGITG